MEQIFPPEFLTWLERMSWQLLHKRASGRTGAHLGKDKGGRVNFLGHHPYTTGDDVRKINWAVAARSDELVVKDFGIETSNAMRVVIDSSASMGYTQKKWQWTLQLGATIAYLSLVAGDKVCIGKLHNDKIKWEAEYSSLRDVKKLLKALSKWKPQGVSNIKQGAKYIKNLDGNNTSWLLLSDFWIEENVESHFAAWGKLRGDVSAIHIISDEETCPSLGRWTLSDAENNEQLNADITKSTQKEYAEKLEQYLEQLHASASRHRVQITQVSSDGVLEFAIGLMLQKRR